MMGVKVAHLEQPALQSLPPRVHPPALQLQLRLASAAQPAVRATAASPLPAQRHGAPSALHMQYRK